MMRNLSLVPNCSLPESRDLPESLGASARLEFNESPITRHFASYFGPRLLQLLLFTLILLVGVASLWAEPLWAEPPVERQIADPRITESSGLAASLLRPGWFWTHNDSGDQARIFAIAKGSDEAAQVVAVLGAEAVDWEDMAAFRWRGQPMLVVGDVGDNARRRESIDLYFFPEPGSGAKSVRAKRLTIQFADGPRDCEGIAIDVDQGRVLLISKGRLPLAGVYSVDLPTNFFGNMSAAQSAVSEAEETPEAEEHEQSITNLVAQRIATFPVPMITAMDISQDGLRLAFITYFDLFVFTRQPDQSWEAALRTPPQHYGLPKLKQIEAVAFDQEGAIWVTSEGQPMVLAKVALDLPAAAAEDR